MILLRSSWLGWLVLTISFRFLWFSFENALVSLNKLNISSDRQRQKLFKIDQSQHKHFLVSWKRNCSRRRKSKELSLSSSSRRLLHKPKCFLSLIKFQCFHRNSVPLFVSSLFSSLVHSAVNEKDVVTGDEQFAFYRFNVWDFPTDKLLLGFYAGTSVARQIDKESAVVQVVFVVPTSTL